MFYLSVISVEIGNVYIASSSKGLVKVSLDTGEFHNWLKSCGEEYMWNDSKNEPAISQLTDYFKGRLREFDLKLDLDATDFQMSVYKALMEVPYGHVVSYKDIALKVNKPGAFRAVGGAVHRNPLPVIVPCHRVICSDGTIGGFAYDIEIKRKLLRIEGVIL
ncbi:methylated-DNA--[protein]-cysteine S-methyltransferase [Caldanaerobius polysaccharolyticus]|uniref:methylated-DNA--[protein]-cysteine S-methyltransferase n=1 Tax=Caldanaerobius polysaccharolyticus TaxID=44256 RepID=UPI0004796430|nr:methylated-DNA--[protein]-cysteine S-methyltransferase [Caldanaerobius polysaccharolyticus]